MLRSPHTAAGIAGVRRACAVKAPWTHDSTSKRRVGPRLHTKSSAGLESAAFSQDIPELQESARRAFNILEIEAPGKLRGHGLNGLRGLGREPQASSLFNDGAITLTPLRVPGARRLKRYILWKIVVKL